LETLVENEGKQPLESILVFLFYEFETITGTKQIKQWYKREKEAL